MYDIDSIVSQEIQTLEDEISNTFCECNHVESEHYVGFITGITKCYGLSYNGTVWESCKCSKLTIMPFKIIVKIEDYADNPQNRKAA